MSLISNIPLFTYIDPVSKKWCQAMKCENGKKVVKDDDLRANQEGFVKESSVKNEKHYPRCFLNIEDRDWYVDGSYKISLPKQKPMPTVWVIGQVLTMDREGDLKEYTLKYLGEVVSEHKNLTDTLALAKAFILEMQDQDSTSVSVEKVLKSILE